MAPVRAPQLLPRSKCIRTWGSYPGGSRSTCLRNDWLAAGANRSSNMWTVSLPGMIPKFEERLASRWSDSFRGDPLALRTINRIRKLCEEYAATRDYKFVIIDTSPSLGVLNKVIISTVDGFVVPCMPDMFSLYGIRNIGRALAAWQRDFKTLLSLLSDSKRSGFPEKFVQFLGFTIYKAKKYSTDSNPWNLATAHYSFAEQIPGTIKRFIPADTFRHLSDDLLSTPIGKTAVMHDHMTMAAMAQKYKRPIWLVPGHGNLDAEDRSTILGNRRRPGCHAQ